jgi:alkylation response protein AidB-like acyl-CoA dehydrogenase
MKFELDGAQQEIKERAAEFADREVAPYAAELDREDRFPTETFEKLADRPGPRGWTAATASADTSSGSRMGG